MDLTSARSKIHGMIAHTLPLYGLPVVVAIAFCAAQSNRADGSTLFATLAQIAATVFLAALIETSWVVSRLSDERHRTVEALDDVNEVIEANPEHPLHQGVREAIKEAKSNVRYYDGQLDSTKSIAREIFAIGVAAIAFPMMALASNDFGTLILGACIYSIGSLAACMYSMYMLRLIQQETNG